MPSMQIIIDINTDEYLASVSQCYKDDELDLKDHIFLSILSDVVFSQVKSNTDLADKITRGLLKKFGEIIKAEEAEESTEAAQYQAAFEEAEKNHP